jgi:predicted chitinase
MLGRPFIPFAAAAGAAVCVCVASACSAPGQERSSTSSGGSNGVSTGGAGGSGVGASTGTGANGGTVPSGSGSGSGGAPAGSGSTGPGSIGTTSVGAGGSSTGATGGAAGALGGGGARDAGSTTDAPSATDAPLPLCTAAEWSRTTAYKAGDVVLYMGKAYVATADNTSLDPTVSTFFWSLYTACRFPPPPPPATCAALDPLLPMGEATYKAMFTPTFQGWVPLAAYSYTSLCRALASPGLTAFAHSGNMVNDKREVAAFFANVALETAYLTYIDENGHTASEQNYHGRGALQLTGQPNYADCGAFLGINLNGQPQLGSQETVVWQSGLWYWMVHPNPSVAGAQISHDAILQGNFGQTVRIIKGDCASATDRATQYRKNCVLLNVDPGNTTCQ